MGHAVRSSKANGFSTIELMLTLLIAGILLAVGIPSFQTIIKNNRLTVTTNEVVGAIGFARAEAVKRGASVHFGPGSGNAGWVVWIDGGDNAPGGANDTEIRVWPALPEGVSVTRESEDNHHVFGGTGLVDKQDTFTVCDDRSGESGSIITLRISGSVDRSSTICG
jgi:type IV fimbrial biogenesis protein FimT